MIRPGLEPGISGSGGRRLIHWANGPCANCANCANAVLRIPDDAEWWNVEASARANACLGTWLHGPRPNCHTVQIGVLGSEAPLGGR